MGVVVRVVDMGVADIEFVKLPGSNLSRGEEGKHMLSEGVWAENHMMLDIPLDWIVVGPTENIDYTPAAAAAAAAGTVRD